MNAIGGYLELELNNYGSVYHDEAIALNTGRSSFEYILFNKNYERVHIPYYTCEVILQPLKRLKIDYEFYHLDKDFLPVKKSIGEREALLYVNYFGVMNSQVTRVLKSFQNVIVDNSQAFFDKPIKDTPTFYSPRKFFGIPDGGFAYVESNMDVTLEQDHSLDRISHLIQRIENGPEAGYKAFIADKMKLNNVSFRKMSQLTFKLLQNINYEFIKEIRNRNFEIIHNALGQMNQLTPILRASFINGSLAYPFLFKGNKSLKNKLIDKRIFVATYWPNVKVWLNKKNTYEAYLQDNLIPIPIDQRYGEKEMLRIIQIITESVS